MGSEKVVFLFDVDNTLLDNDHVTADLMRYLKREVGDELQRRYWVLFEELRLELGYADYLGALQRYRVENPHDPHLLTVSRFLISYPFANRLYPNSIDVIERCNEWGSSTVLSDGDVVFQPRKIQRSGIGEAVNERVLIYIHKEQELEHVRRRFPADRYVVIDDKLRILMAIKKAWGDRVTTVFPKQGHYASDPEILKEFPPATAADITVDRIGQLLEYDLATIVAAARHGVS